MTEFLKGTYDIGREIVDDETGSESADEFTRQALNSIGGSMVFVERKRMVWKGDDESTGEY